MLQVTEDPGGQNYSASYTYDGLDNLTGVRQAGLATCKSANQTRRFNYDSLKELFSATNLESGPITYSYDADGNISQKTPGSVTTNYAYDFRCG